MSDTAVLAERHLFVAREMPETIAPKENGQAKLAAILKARGIDHSYEPLQWPLVFRQGKPVVCFRPDFVLKATRRRPGVCLELTWADRALGTKRDAHGRELLRRKHFQIAKLWEKYGVIGVLITYTEYQKILRNYSYLDELIEQALCRRQQLSAA